MRRIAIRNDSDDACEVNFEVLTLLFTFASFALPSSKSEID